MASLVVAITYFTVVSPVGQQGSVEATNVLLGAVILFCALFSLSQVCLRALTSANPRKIAYLSSVMALSVVELLLISSLQLLSPTIFVAIIIFNLLTFWYLHKRIVTK